MSEIIYRLIPSDADTVLPQEAVEAAVAYLKKAIGTNEIVFLIAQVPVFVDCGRALHQLLCPICHEPLSLFWWAESMGRAAESDFRLRMVQFPCCRKFGMLDDIEYIEPCGLARVIIEIREANIILSSEILNTLRLMLGCDLRLIRAEY